MHVVRVANIHKYFLLQFCQLNSWNYKAAKEQKKKDLHHESICNKHRLVLRSTWSAGKVCTANQWHVVRSTDGSLMKAAVVEQQQELHATQALVFNVKLKQPPRQDRCPRSIAIRKLGSINIRAILGMKQHENPRQNNYFQVIKVSAFRARSCRSYGETTEVLEAGELSAGSETSSGISCQRNSRDFEYSFIKRGKSGLCLFWFDSITQIPGRHIVLYILTINYPAWRLFTEPLVVFQT